MGGGRYCEYVGNELRVKLQGPRGGMDAGRALDDLRQILHLLGELEDAYVRGPARERSTWAFSHLAMGSIEAGFAPRERHGKSTWGDLDRVVLRVVEGFAEAEEHEAIPAGWTPEAATPAERVCRHLGTTIDSGMRLTVIEGGRETKHAEVTRRVQANLRAAKKVRRETIGSVTGFLGSLNVRGTGTAGVWLDRGGQRVTVKFDRDRLEELRPWIGRRVEVRGRLSRNAGDQILRVRMSHVEPLPSVEESPALTGLVGAAPGITGGLSIREHLERLRGAS